MPHSFYVRMVIAAVMPFMIMLTGCITLYQASQVEQRTARSVAQTLGVIADANHLMRLFMDAETAQRGYALTSDGDYLAPYQRALSMFPRTLGTLRDSVQGETQQQRLARANRLFRQWVKNVANVSIVETQDNDSDLPGAATLSSKRLVDEFRVIMGNFIDTEEASLHVRQSDSRDAAMNAQRIMIVSILLALAGALVTWWPLFQRTRHAVMEITQRSRRMVEGDLSQRVILPGRDEFAWMAHAFNAMAARLEALVITEKRTSRELAERVHALVQERTRDMRARHTLIETLQACRDTRSAQDALRDQLPHVFSHARGGALWCLDMHSPQPPQRVCHWGDTPENDVQTVQRCHALHTGQPQDIALPSTRHASACPHVLASPTPGRHLCLPLKGSEGILGVLQVHWLPERDADDDNDARVDFAKGVAEDMVLSLSNVRLREQLEEASIRDALTGLYNRRFLDETLARELARAERQVVPLCVLMLDIDHFKPINDDYGHALGDRALVAVAELLNAHVRRDDIVCRYGGEEFVIIMPGADLDAAQRRGDHLRRCVSALDVEANVPAPIRLTVSLGLACYPQHGDNAERLLHSADMALYEAKQGGRNRLTIASP
ncbi:diguanylate cyclase [Chromohalobacter sp.]|uniref:sensor domain-containing diguanylate cyclase n=1 Tax=Chromohalobacter sp. TaxID=50740 RepID=UPI001E081BFE|nr:diguanylate cyclase [Chromohalobacter sp.]NQY44680.1 diguanylate cyclase [Chromohalobacter sp.]